MNYRIATIVHTAMAAAIALTAACSDDNANSEKRKQAREYYQNTNTIIPATEEIISFPALPARENSRPLPNPHRNACFDTLHAT